MLPILRNIVAVVAGFLTGSAINMAILGLGPQVIPLPAGVDLSDTSDMHKFAENLKLLKPANFIAPWLAHAVGTLLGAFVAASIAASHKRKFALVIGVLFLLGGIAMVALVGGPLWFAVVDLVGAYLPMAYLGWLLACGKTRNSPTSPAPAASQ